MIISGLVATACLALSGEHITAGDLARALPGFAPGNPSTVVAWSPQPGMTRVFHSAELGRIVASLGSSGDVVQNNVPPGDVCFERPALPLSEAAVLDAMRKTLGTAAKIELVEVSHFPAPAGEIVFPPESLGTSPLALWRGFVRYDGKSRFPIWARVRVRVAITHVVAIETLQPGKPVLASQLRVETNDGSPERVPAPVAIKDVEGYIPRRTIPADSPVLADAIDPPLAIAKGDRVTVRVHSGLAALTFDVVASSSGRCGDIISLRNPQSGKIFRARVDGIKTASVQTDTVTQ